jgi:hypothetical protein
MATERAVAIAARDHRDDPWLIGFFADNELAWAGPGDDPKSRYALAYGTLRMTTDVPAKRAFLKQLRDKYRNEDGLSKAWGIHLSGWELMEDPGFEPPMPNPEHPEIEADFKYFQQTFADAYFKTISDSLKWHAPNQLLLGGRYAVSTPESVASCAQYCDVLSFNMYTLKPQDGYDFAALRALDKPVLITEFNFGSADRGGLCVAFLQQYIELGQAHVAATALGQGESKVQAAVAHQVGQVFVDDLLLQRDSGGGDHQAFACSLGGRDRGQAVGHGLARTGAGLDGHDCGVATAPTFVVGVDIPEDFGHFGDHQALAVARFQALGFEKTRIGALDRGFEFSADHGLSGAKNAG